MNTGTVGSVKLGETLICLVIKRSFATVDDFAVDICGIGISAEDDITDLERAYRMSTLVRWMVGDE